MKYQVQQIDVWGNAVGGWEYNNLYSLGEIELESLETESIVDRMIEEDYFTERARGKVIEPFDDSDSHITFCDSENGRPFYQLVRIDD